MTIVHILDQDFLKNIICGEDSCLQILSNFILCSTVQHTLEDTVCEIKICGEALERSVLVSKYLFHKDRPLHETVKRRDKVLLGRCVILFSVFETLAYATEM